MCDKGQTLVDSSVPPAPQQQRLSEMQRFKADCKPEELSKLKTRCELLVRDCIAGLLVNLSVQDFKEIEEELNRASCWYLTCDRYWEDSPPETRASPWTLLALMGAMLAVGVVVCYYIIWVLFEPAPPTQPTPVPTAAHQYHHQLHHHQASQPIMTPIMSHHHHYPMHHSPHMSHMQHAGPLGGQHSPLAGQHVPRGSPMGPMGPMGRGAHQGSPKQQEPNPYEREWRI